MAKADKGKKAKETETKAKKEAAPEFKYGVSDIADAMDIKEASVRVQLRNKGIAKAGKSYGWNSKADLQEVIDRLKAADAKPAKKDKKAESKAAAKSSKKGGKKSKDEDDD